MSNIPDFAFQLQEIERQLRAQADVTAAVWQDGVQQRFYKEHVDHFCHIIELVINGEHHGDYDIHKRSMNKMLEGISNCIDRMAQASETSSSTLFDMAMGGMHDGSIRDHSGWSINVESIGKVHDRDGVVYDDELDRDYWSRINGPKPGSMESEDLNHHMKRRRGGW